MRLVKTDAGYMHIKPAHKSFNNGEEARNYNSKTNPLTREELEEYLSYLRLI